MSYWVYPSAVVPSFFLIPQQSVNNCEITNLVPPTNQLVSPAVQTLPHCEIPQEHRLSQESYARTVRMMSVEETANWIWALSTNAGWWNEAAYYAREFQLHGISGVFLHQLTEDNLKELSVMNHYHRAVILWNIRQIFSPPSTILLDASFSPQYQEVNESVTISSWIEVDTGRRNPAVIHPESPIPSAQMRESTDTIYTQSGASSPVSRGSLSNMELSQSEASEVEDELVPTSLRSRSLKLKSLPANDQFCEEDFHCVFQKHGVKVVEIICKSEESGEFIVKFESIIKAQKALNINKAKNIGYDLRPNWPERVKSTCPREFIVLSKKLTVREEKRLTSNIVCTKFKDDIIYVNKIVGRRARLVNKADRQQLGWTSLFTEKGCPLLEQVEDNWMKIRRASF